MALIRGDGPKRLVVERLSFDRIAIAIAEFQPGICKVNQVASFRVCQPGELKLLHAFIKRTMIRHSRWDTKPPSALVGCAKDFALKVPERFQNAARVR
jgi:hypothetical protein